MSLEVFGYITILLAVASVFCRPGTVALFLGVLSLHGGSAAISFGSLTLNPFALFIPVLAAKAFSSPSSKKEKQLGFRAGKYLLAFLTYSLFITIIGPILFRDNIYVYWDARDGLDYALKPLAPGVGNITQLLYLFLGVLVFFASRRIFRSQVASETIIRIFLCVSFFYLFWSVADIVTYYSGTSEYLFFLRNGNYTQHVSVEAAGIKRLVGSFQEASAYASYGMVLFAFVFTLFRAGYKTLLTGTISALLLLGLILSTATTAYVGLSLYFAWLILRVIFRILFKGRISLSAFLGIGSLILLICCVVGYSVSNGNIPILDEMVFNKADSYSAKERGTWNLAAWDAFVDSYGLGIGLGSTRASSLFLVLLSSSGLIGTIFYVLFVFSTCRSKGYGDNQIKNTATMACREGIIGFLISALLSSGLIGSSVPLFLLAGAIAGFKEGENVQQRPRSRIISHLN